MYHDHAHIGYLLGCIYARVAEEESNHYGAENVHAKLQICESLEDTKRERGAGSLVSIRLGNKREWES